MQQTKDRVTRADRVLGGVLCVLVKTKQNLGKTQNDTPLEDEKEGEREARWRSIKRL